MQIEEFQGYIIPALIIGFFAYRFWKFKRIKSLIPQYLEQGAIVVDVRTANEYQSGHRPGSLNIPLNDLNSRSKELDSKKIIILCCASGTRSGLAVGILKKNGFAQVMNASPWTNTLI